MKEDEKMSRLIRSNQSGKKRAVVIIILLLIIIGAVAFGINRLSSNNNKIFKGVKVENLSLGLEDMTKEEAQNTVSSIQEIIRGKEYKLEYNGTTVSFRGEELDLKVSDSIVEEAYNAGREGGIFGAIVSGVKSSLGQDIATLNADITLNDEALKEKVLKVVEDYGAAAEDSTYKISGDYIYITKGCDGVDPNYNKVKEDLLAVVGDLDNNNTIVVDATVKKGTDIDFDRLYKDTYVEKVNASFSDDGKYTAEKIGVSFNKTIAVSEYQNLKPKGEMTVKLIKDVPEVTTANLDDVLFGDVLGTFRTTYNASNTNRSTNLMLASNSINGTILLPGQEFSYNKTLGERTAARGYKEAHIYQGGEVVDGLGGGICQISSTLYNAVLLANLEVTNRKSHMFWPEYVKPSFDATVVWGSIDFNFKNNRKTPIKIEASAKSGVALVTIYGKKQDDDPIIELYSKEIQKRPYNTKTVNDPTLEEGKQIVSQQPVIGYVSEGYKIFKDSNGKEIKRELISKDSYQPTDKIIKMGTKKTGSTATTNPVETVPVPQELYVEEPTPTTNPIEETPQVEEPVTTTPVEETPATTTEQPNGSNNQWPTGWDTPENPNYKG